MLCSFSLAKSYFMSLTASLSELHRQYCSGFFWLRKSSVSTIMFSKSCFYINICLDCFLENKIQLTGKISQNDGMSTFFSLSVFCLTVGTQPPTLLFILQTQHKDFNQISIIQSFKCCLDSKQYKWQTTSFNIRRKAMMVWH